MRFQKYLLCTLGALAVVFGLYDFLIAQQGSGLSFLIPIVIGALVFTLAFNLNQQDE